MNNAEELAKELMTGYPLAPDAIGGALELRRLSAENAELRARLDAIYSTEPVAWFRTDGYGISLCAAEDKSRWSLTDRQLFDMYTLPLIPLPEKS